MAQGLNTSEPEVLFEWTFAEYEQYARSPRWYVLAGLIAVGLLTYAFVSRNFLFAIIIVMLGVVMYLRHTSDPREVTCIIARRGITCDGRFTAFEDVEEFFVVEDNSQRTLNLDPRGLRPRLTIPISDVDVEALRSALAERIPESQNPEERGADLLGRMFKL